jgi:hypothetical protein
MTTVYGVTFVGARAQIERQLKDRGGFGRLECWDASHYLARTVRYFNTLHLIGLLPGPFYKDFELHRQSLHRSNTNSKLAL